MQLAKKTKFIKRERKIKPDIIFWSLALGFCDRSQRTIAGFKLQVLSVYMKKKQILH